MEFFRIPQKSYKENAFTAAEKKAVDDKCLSPTLQERIFVALSIVTSC